mmetsp:Transcript_31243/g.72862  ORF Transcript_31243/g.72862 Transcript_31243/m.72862 type:complete len:316 (+) Transcript_31243:62-1009(+)
MGTGVRIDLTDETEDEGTPATKRRRVEPQATSQDSTQARSLAAFFRAKCRSGSATTAQAIPMRRSIAGDASNPQAVMLVDTLKQRGMGGTGSHRASVRSPCSAEASPLSAQVLYLTSDARSWVVVARKWWPSDREAFSAQWQMHPQEYHAIRLFGRICYETRYSQSWGNGYRYSGTENKARPIEENPFVADLIKECNQVAGWLGPYNTCLQNWYEPRHAIALHSDDEKSHRLGSAIFSLSWGGPRRFILRAKDSVSSSSGRSVAEEEIWLHDGDLLVMGGSCQATHKHEVPKVRQKDPVATNRINWTVRAFKDVM